MRDHSVRAVRRAAIALSIAAGPLACSDAPEPTPLVASVTAVADAAPSVSAPPPAPPAGCPKLVEALGLRRGFPVLAPQSKAELEQAVGDLEARMRAFEGIQGGLDPDSTRVGRALTASFSELVAMMRGETPRPGAASAGASVGSAAPSAAAGAPATSKTPARAGASASAEPLYDTKDWSAINDRFVDAWKSASALCPR